MRASKLRQRITIQSNEATRSPSGAVIEGWRDYTSVYCSIEPLSVKDLLTAKAVNSKTVMRCVLRYREDIVTGMRVIYKSKVYQINGTPLADPNSGNEYMTMTLESVE